MLKIVFTCGDINGIGPEICLKTIQKVFDKNKYQLSLICPKSVFNYYSEKLKFSIPVNFFTSSDSISLSSDQLSVISLDDFSIYLGKPTPDSGIISYNAIETAVNLTKAKLADAIITAPISKKSFELADINENGHTEILARLTGTNDYCMVFLSEIMNAALATIHIPLNKVAGSLTKEKLIKLFGTVRQTLVNDLLIKNPEIAVLGLNPHAGEQGKIGTEEIDIIEPAILKMESNNISGPFVPDAFFANKLYKKFDAVIGMYHDQVLIPFKLLNFSKGVNFTAGLPIVRTSPDHGTAHDIAGKLIADASSMIEAFNWSVKIAVNRKI